LVDGGYAALREGVGVHTIDDPTLRLVRNLSRLSPTSCVAGSFALRQPGGMMTNSALVFQRGRCIHRYDKIHLFRPADEPRLFRPGKTFRSFAITVNRVRLRAGVILCYDLRFPELIRFLAREGIELLLVPARWPVVRDEAWQTLLKARAIENQLFVAGCNAQGEEGTVRV
jgi:predicted amidohydrolase